MTSKSSLNSSQFSTTKFFYSGQIDQNGRADGQGFLMNPEQSSNSVQSQSSVNIKSYVGDFKNGQFNGNGILILSNGNKLEGTFLNDLPHGSQILLNSNEGGFVLQASFDNGRIVSGISTWKDGSSFEGLFENDIPYSGKFVFSNGFELKGTISFSDELEFQNQTQKLKYFYHYLKEITWIVFQNEEEEKEENEIVELSPKEKKFEIRWDFETKELKWKEFLGEISSDNDSIQMIEKENRKLELDQLQQEIETFEHQNAQNQQQQTLKNNNSNQNANVNNNNNNNATNGEGNKHKKKNKKRKRQQMEQEENETRDKTHEQTTPVKTPENTTITTTNQNNNQSKSPKAIKTFPSPNHNNNNNNNKNSNSNNNKQMNQNVKTEIPPPSSPAFTDMKKKKQKHNHQAIDLRTPDVSKKNESKNTNGFYTNQDKKYLPLSSPSTPLSSKQIPTHLFFVNNESEVNSKYSNSLNNKQKSSNRKSTPRIGQFSLHENEN